MIYTDGIHIITDGSIEELHEFAKRAKIKRSWFDNNSKHPHYDIPKKIKILPEDIQIVSSKEIIKILRKKNDL